MKKVLSALLLLSTLWIQPVSAEHPKKNAVTVYMLGNSECSECLMFVRYIKNFYDETKWHKIATLEMIVTDPRIPQMIPDWFKEAYLEDRIQPVEPYNLPAYIVWVKTDKHPKGREIGRFAGFREPAGWYEKLTVMLNAIKPHMKDGVFQEDGPTK